MGTRSDEEHTNDKLLDILNEQAIKPGMRKEDEEANKKDRGASAMDGG